MFTKRLTQIIIVFSVCLAIFLSFQMINDINNLKQDVQSFQQELTQIQAQQADLNKRIQSWQPVTTVTTEPTATYKRDVPLSDELQRFTYDTCGKYGVDYDLVLAIMREESQYTSGLISDDGQDYGMMQINKSNFSWLASDYKLKDMLNAEQNITAGVIILDMLQDQYDTVEGVLLGYNLKPALAREYYEQGKTTEYVEKVMNNG